MTEVAKSLVFQDLGPQCCKDASNKSVDPSGEDGPPPPTPCDLQDGEPVGANSGNLTDYRIDLTIPAKLPFGITPYYNSDNPYFGHLGYGWSSILSVRLFHWPDSTWSLRDPWGRRENFDASGKHDSTGGRFYGDTLHIAGDSVVLRVDEKTTWVFDRADGTLREVHNDAGHGYRLVYDASADPRSQAVAGTTRRKYPIKGISKYAIPRGLRSIIAMDFRVVALEDKANPAHRIQIVYDTSGMVSTAADHVGRSVGYSYDLSGNLSQVRHVDSTVQRWRFEDSTDAHRISAFDPLPLGAEDTLDPARMLKNKWDRLGRVVGQVMSRGDTKQEHSFERNPYSTTCTENSGATGSWTKRCTHVRATTVNRTDADGLGGSRQSSRTYLDSVVNDIPMSQQNQSGPANFVGRHITLTESVNSDIIRLKLIFDDKNNVKKVLRPDGTEMFLYGPSGEGGIIGPLVSAVSQQPPTGRGPKRTDGNAFSFSYSGSITNGLTEADSWSFQNGSPFTYRTEKLRSLKGEVNGTTYQYGFDTAKTHKSFDAKGRLDSLYGFHGFEAKAWYTADTSALPDSFTYADGTGLRIWRDGLGQITATRDALGRTSHFRYTAKGDVKMACGPDSLCVWNTWKNRAIVGTLVGMRLRPDGSMTSPLESYAYRVNDQKRRTHTFRVVGSDSILIEKRLLDVWGNLAKRWVNPDTANTDSLQWQEVETNAYDARNRRIQHASKVNGQWQTVAYQYDVLGNLTKLTDARGVWTHVKMDAYGNVVSRRDTLGRTWSATYNERGLPLTETDPLGRVVSHEWNHLGNETKRIGWRQDTTHWIWQHDRLLKHRTPEGRWTVFGYDTLSRLVRAVSKVGDSALAPDADDLVTTWTYDKVGNRVTETVAGHKTHGWNVDGSGNVLADTNALGQVTRYVYDDLGQVTAVVGPTGDTLSVGYDRRGNLASLSVGRDTLVQSRWDNLGRPLQSRRPGQGTITRTFDAIGYLQSVKDSSGLASTFTADPVGADAQATEGAKPARRIEPDLVGRVVSEWNETGLGTFTVWDSVDRMKEIRSGATSPGNLVVSYVYGDSAGGSSRTTTWASGKTESHAWDRDGLLRRFTDGRGITASFNYDSLARMTGITYTKPDGSVAGPSKRFRYSVEGWLLAMEHGAVVDSFVRDGLGRVMKSWQTVSGTTRTLEHHRNDAARLDTLVYPDGKRVVRRMDTRGNLVSVWREGVRLDTLVYANGLRRSTQLGNGIATAYEYDANGRVMRQTNRRGADLVTGHEFGYTPEGNLAYQKRLHQPGQSEVYHYTTDDQLDRAQRGAIDANGQIPNPTRDWSWSIFEGEGKWFQYADAGGSHTRYHSGDEVSSLTGDQPMVFAWDGAGNMTRRGGDTLFWTADGRLDSVGGKAKLVYDALGRLVQWRPVGGEAVTTTWDGWQEVFESSDSHTRSFIAGNGIDEKVAVVTNSAGTETTIYPLVGNNGNVEAVTDGAGNLIRTFLVDPYGTFSVTTAPGADGVWFTADDVTGDASALDGEFVFQGRPWYGSLGLYTFRSRWMDPKLGLFISRDPLGPESDLNGYRFERNNPLGGADPMGEDWGDFVDGMYDGATGVGYGLAIAGGVMLAGALAPELAVLAGAAAVAVNAYGLYGLADEAVGIATGLDADGNPICNRLGRAHRLAGNLLVGVLAGKVGKRIGKAARAKLGAKFNAEAGKSGSRSGRGAEPQGNLAPRATPPLESGRTPQASSTPLSVKEPQAGGGANLSNISSSEAIRIQNAADRTGQKITVVGSRAAGAAQEGSDWDYIMSGKSRQRQSASSSVPRGNSGGETSRPGLDVFQDYNPLAPQYTTLDQTQPHITFYPKPR